MRSFFLQVHVKLRTERMEGLAYVKSVQRTGENVSLSSPFKKTQRCYNQTDQGDCFALEWFWQTLQRTGQSQIGEKTSGGQNSLVFSFLATGTARSFSR